MSVHQWVSGGFIQRTDYYRSGSRVAVFRCTRCGATTTKSPSHTAVVNAFKEAGQTEADALTQARIARICRATEYDLERRQVILWEPPGPDYRVTESKPAEQPAPQTPPPTAPPVAESLFGPGEQRHRIA